MDPHQKMESSSPRPTRVSSDWRAASRIFSRVSLVDLLQRDCIRMGSSRTPSTPQSGAHTASHQMVAMPPPGERWAATNLPLPTHYRPIDPVRYDLAPTPPTYSPFRGLASTAAPLCLVACQYQRFRVAFDLTGDSRLR